MQTALSHSCRGARRQGQLKYEARLPEDQAVELAGLEAVEAEDYVHELSLTHLRAHETDSYLV